MLSSRSAFAQPLTFVGVIALYVGATGCAEPPVPDAGCAADQCPEGGCGVTLACRADSDCPLGTACSSGTCQVVPFPRVDRDTLIRGFDVPEFELRKVSDAPATFEWARPEDARRVTCALFTSRPEFPRVRERTEHTLIRMNNPGRAIERERVFNAEASATNQRFRFTLGDLEPSTRCPSTLAVNGAFASQHYAVVELLRLGCWAFDSAKVIAATQLLTILPEHLPDWNTVPKTSCSDQPNGTWCRMPGTPGRCKSGRCDTTAPEPVASPPGTPVDEGAAGAGGLGTLSTEPLTDCSNAMEDTACVVPNTAVGQCLELECIAQGSQDYRPPLVVSNCTASGTDGLNCFPSPIFSFGNCHQGGCRPRCRTTSDCADQLERAGLGDAPPHECNRAKDAYVGICEARSP